MKYFKYILFFIALASSYSLKAQDFKFYANGVDTAYLGENFKVVFVIEDAKKVKNFKPPNFINFEVVSEQQGSSTVNVNGKVSQSFYLTYYLKAKKEGNLAIGGATANINGYSVKTNTFNVFVLPAREQKNKQNLTQKEKNSNQLDLNKDVFIRLITNNTQPYVGEPINLIAKLYFKVSIRDLQLAKIPEFNDFWNEEVNINQQERKVEEYNGEEYYTVNLNQYTLIPLKEGKLKIPPFEFNSIVEAQVLKSHPFWGQYYDYDIIEHKIQCNSLLIQAKPLPENGKPANFNGAVGSFQLYTSIDTDTVEYDNAINLTATISGKGNFTMFDTPSIHLPEDFEVYEPEIDEKIKALNGSKKYHYFIVPKTPGEYKTAPVSFSYFDIKNKSYKTLFSDSITFKIGGELPEEEILAVENIDSIPENEIYPIVKKIKLNSFPNNFYGSAKYYTALASPFFLFFLIFIAKQAKENSLVDVAAIKKKRASKEARKRLKKANTHLKNQDKKAFYTEIFDALNGYVSDKLDISQADLNKEVIIQNFSKKQVAEHLANQFIEVLTNAEAALYSPASASKMQEDYNTAINWIVEIEHEIN